MAAKPLMRASLPPGTAPFLFNGRGGGVARLLHELGYVGEDGSLISSAGNISGSQAGS